MPHQLCSSITTTTKSLLRKRICAVYHYNRQATLWQMPITSYTTLALPTPVNNSNRNYHRYYDSRNYAPDSNLLPLFLASATILSGLLTTSSFDRKTDCCGIVGVVGTGQYDARYENSLFFAFLLKVSKKYFCYNDLTFKTSYPIFYQGLLAGGIDGTKKSRLR